MGKIIVKIIWIWKNTIEMRIRVAERIFLIVEVLNHGYGESWMFLRTLGDRKDFSHGYNGYIFQQSVLTTFSFCRAFTQRGL